MRATAAPPKQPIMPVRPVFSVMQPPAPRRALGNPWEAMGTMSTEGARSRVRVGFAPARFRPRPVSPPTGFDPAVFTHAGFAPARFPPRPVSIPPGFDPPRFAPARFRLHRVTPPPGFALTGFAPVGARCRSGSGNATSVKKYAQKRIISFIGKRAIYYARRSENQVRPGFAGKTPRFAGFFSGKRAR